MGELGCVNAMQISNNPIQTVTEIRFEWPPAGERARKVVRRSNLRVTGKYPSFRTESSIHYESFIERDCFRILDADHTVLNFYEQPVTIHYVCNGVERKHYPDVLVNGKGYREFWEVKAADDPDIDVAFARAAALTPLLINLGYGYQVITCDKIRAEPRFSNAKMLLRLGRSPLDSLTREGLRRHFETAGCTTWHHILAGQLGDYGPSQVARLILEGRLSYDRSKHLGPTTIVGLSEPHQGESTWL